MPANPFTDIVDAFWKMAMRNEQLRIYIPLGNRIKFDQPNEPTQAKANADRTELMLMPSGGKVNIQNTSTTTEVVRQYTWSITTDNFKLADPFEIVGWELLRAMVDYDKVLCALQWQGQHYVKKCTSIDINEGLIPTEPLVPTSIKGWTGLWTCELECHFATADLRIK